MAFHTRAKTRKRTERSEMNMPLESCQGCLFARDRMRYRCRPDPAEIPHNSEKAAAFSRFQSNLRA